MPSCSSLSFPVFLTFHYEKGLGVGDALFFTFAIIFGATIVAIIVVFSLIWLLMLTGRVIRYFKKENQAQPEEKEEKKVASPKELGPIDEERLAPYFKSTFKGMGGGKVNYFRILLDTMNTFRTESQRNVGAVALLIYQSDKLNNLKPDSFSKWIEILFECMRLDVPADRSQNKYKLEKRKDKDMKLSRTFTYL